MFLSTREDDRYYIDIGNSLARLACLYDPTEQTLDHAAQSTELPEQLSLPSQLSMTKTALASA